MLRSDERIEFSMIMMVVVLMIQLMIFIMMAKFELIRFGCGCDWCVGAVDVGGSW